MRLRDTAGLPAQDHIKQRCSHPVTRDATRQRADDLQSPFAERDPIRECHRGRDHDQERTRPEKKQTALGKLRPEKLRLVHPGTSARPGWQAAAQLVSCKFMRVTDQTIAVEFSLSRGQWTKEVLD